MSTPNTSKNQSVVDNQWCPDRCPITFRPFFMWIEHPTLGHVPTYGGPFDSYTILEPDNLPEKGRIAYHDVELTTHRYDHDQGGWVGDGEYSGMRVVSEDHLNEITFAKEEAAEKLRESQAQIVALRDALTQYREAFSDGPENCGCILWEKVDEIAAAALSCPPPPCVPLAEAQSLADALQSLRDEQNGPPLERHKEHWQAAYDNANKVLAEFTAKHSQP